MVIKFLKRRRKIWIRFGFGLLLVAGLAAVFYFLRLNEYASLDRLVVFVDKTRLNPWSQILFYALFTIGVLFIPITIFPIVGGVLFPFWVALPLNLMAAIGGSLMAFLLARFFGREMIEPLLKGRLRDFDKGVASQGVKAVFLMRWIGIPPFIIANYALGLSRVKIRHYLLGTVLGIFPWTVFVTYSAQSLWNAVLVGGKQGLRHALVVTMGPLVGLSIFILLSVLTVYYVKSRRKISTAPSPVA